MVLLPYLLLDKYCAMASNWTCQVCTAWHEWYAGPSIVETDCPELTILCLFDRVDLVRLGVYNPLNMFYSYINRWCSTLFMYCIGENLLCMHWSGTPSSAPIHGCLFLGTAIEARSRRPSREPANNKLARLSINKTVISTTPALHQYTAFDFYALRIVCDFFAAEIHPSTVHWPR